MPASRFHKRGPNPHLTQEQQVYIRGLICKLPPWRYSIKGQLWTRDNVRRLVKRKSGVELSLRTIDTYLKQWGFILEVPSVQPADRCSKDIKSWLKMNYSDLERQATECGAKIWWLNPAINLDSSKWTQEDATQDIDAGIEQEQARLNEYVASLSGEALMHALGSPLRRTRRKYPPGRMIRKHIMISSITDAGQLLWRAIDGNFTFERKERFLNGLVDDSRCAKLFVIRPNWTTYPQIDDYKLQKACKDRIQFFPENRDVISLSPALPPPGKKPTFSTPATCPDDGRATAPRNFVESG